MLKRASIPIYSQTHLLSSNAGDQGAFVDRHLRKYIDNRNAHAHQYTRWKHQIRGFADVRSDCSKRSSAHLPWPDLKSPAAIPTPYEIFHLDQNAIYSKQQFYELVKVYHPDRNHTEPSMSDDSSLSNDVRIERYRLVVAANEILSDPVKRSAYDTYGLGWGKNIEKSHPEYDSKHYYRTKWSGFYADDSPMKNATWEDWERWYQRHNREKQDSMYISNATFLSMAIALTSLMAVLQAKTMGATASASPTRFEIMTGECNKNLQDRRTTSCESDGKHHTLQMFLESRAPHTDGVLEPRNDVSTKLSSPRES